MIPTKLEKLYLKKVAHLTTEKFAKRKSMQRNQWIALACFWLGIVLLFAVPARQLLQIAFTLIGFIPVFVLIFGFATWRNLCPLALHSTLAGQFRRPSKKRQWFTQWWLPPALLVVFVYLRLLGLNAMPSLMAGLLVAMAIGAAISGCIFGGRAWCHYFCPMGPVERLFERAAWRITPRSNASMCSPCVGCIQQCSDINFQVSQRAKASAFADRFLAYSYPGLVAGFVGWPWLHQGNLAAWLQSKWYFEANPLKTLAGTGFFFLPHCPKWMAIALTLAATTTLSYLCFSHLERRYLPKNLQTIALRVGAGMFTLCILLPLVLPWMTILVAYASIFFAVFWIALIPTKVPAK